MTPRSEPRRTERADDQQWPRRPYNPEVLLAHQTDELRQHRDHIVLPRPLAVLRHSLPTVIEGKLIPVLVFVGFLQVVGMTAALLSALTWSVGCVVWRLSARRPIPGLVLFSVLGLGARTVVALASGSLVVYFLQPTITTALVGLAFLLSVPLGRPLAERLAHDFCPLDPDTAQHPALRRFFLHMSLLWAGTSLVNATVTLWLLLTQSPTTFVIIKSFLGPVSTGMMALVALPLFIRSMRVAGIRVRFG